MQGYFGKDPVSPREWLPELPLDWEEAILRCLEKRPEDRPRDGAVLAHDLAQLRVAQVAAVLVTGRLALGLDPA